MQALRFCKSNSDFRPTEAPEISDLRVDWKVNEHYVTVVTNLVNKVM